MGARPLSNQPDLFTAMPCQARPVVKQPSPKAKPPCTQCSESYLTVQEVANRYKVFRSTVWRWVENDPGFPKPVKLSPGTTRWLQSDLMRFEQSQKTKTNQPLRKKGGR